jgi:hypothetical protein
MRGRGVNLVLAGVLLLWSAVGWGEEYACAYKGFVGDEPVILKIEIRGQETSVDGRKAALVKNTDTGIIIEMLSKGIRMQRSDMGCAYG